MNATLVPHLSRRGAVQKLPVFGVDVEILASAAQTGGHAASYHVTCAPGTGAPPHRHIGEDESFYVLEGEFEFLCGETMHRLKAGDFIFAPRNTPHAFTCLGPRSGRLLGFCTPGGHEEFFKDCACAIAENTFSAEKGMEICQRHGIELMPPK